MNCFDSQRRLLLKSAAALTLTGCERWFEPTPALLYPGMQAGHLIRDQHALPAPSFQLDTEVAILGSGIAGLSAAWQLSKQNFRNFILLQGPEAGGNAAGGAFGDLAYPRGAHYLPLASKESMHVRELLFDLGVILEQPFDAAPLYDETCIVHAPSERLLMNGRWQEGLLPSAGIAAPELAQQQRFFSLIESLKIARGNDGKKAFAIPLVWSSTDTQWRALDRLTFLDWLRQQHYDAPSLLWYLNYVCRDEYGAGYERVSAWAGLHYFASRNGHARNAEDGAVLTWPDGLEALVRKMHAAIGQRMPVRDWQRPGFVVRIDAHADRVKVLCARQLASGLQTFTLNARRVICAMPLLMAARVLPTIAEFGFDPARDLPQYSPWLVSNFLLDRWPRELAGAPLSWDNVVYQGHGLGYVVSTHQQIRVAAPAQTVLSAYHAPSWLTPTAARKWMLDSKPAALLNEVGSDLRQAYGTALARHAQALEITLRGHAMAAPLPGFLSNRGLLALRAADQRVLFAHADLSGLSVFEEAAWWGMQAAWKILG